MSSKALVVLTLVAAGGGLHRAGAETLQLAGRDAVALSAWDTRVDALLADGSLRLRRTWTDTLLPGRTHERLGQVHRGLPVFGAELVRQREGGITRSLYGTLHEGIALDPEPRLRVAEAVALAEAEAGAPSGPRFRPELVVLPLQAGGYALTYLVRVFTGGDLLALFVDAHDGSIRLRLSERKTQSVGRGTGVLGDEKKLSGQPQGGAFVARDRLRPPAIETFDMDGNLNRTLIYLNGFIELDDSDLARDSDNTWEDGAAVDAHVYAGYFYDYLYQRFGRRGLDDADITIKSLVHPVNRSDLFDYDEVIQNLFFVNAFYLTDGIMVYGEGLPEDVTFLGTTWTYFSAGLDVVAHELTHGVTEYSSRLIYQNESGALNEAFSDVMAVGAEFFLQPPGGGPLQADYLLGEDVLADGAIRSVSDPTVYGDPDHYAVRFTGTADSGGVHINSGIVNHAFFLAIEGGTNRVSGLAVQGVGGANRERVEQAFYRAFVFLLPPDARFQTARAATVQAAGELFGTGSDTERAIRDAWTAVGVE
jgi:thermolysin